MDKQYRVIHLINDVLLLSSLHLSFFVLIFDLQIAGTCESPTKQQTQRKPQKKKNTKKTMTKTTKTTTIQQTQRKQNNKHTQRKQEENNKHK